MMTAPAMIRCAVIRNSLDKVQQSSIRSGIPERSFAKGLEGRRRRACLAQVLRQRRTWLGRQAHARPGREPGDPDPLTSGTT